MSLALLATLSGLFIWIAILLLPWRPWSTRETLDSDYATDDPVNLSNVSVLIPARNEAENIVETLTALGQQGQGLKVILVDDESTDDTIQQAKSVALHDLTIVNGTPLPTGWSGKLWALEQGRQHVTTRYLLLLDADITLAPGLLATVLNKVEHDGLNMLSLMAFLKMQTAWERFLMPAFIFFFKLLYPFHLANKPGNRFAAAAGGFILIEAEVMQRLGGFACIKDALIDDCSLATQVKRQGYKCWTGLTHSARSIRSYDDLESIWHMVTRTAYTQLFYSPLLLLVCTALMMMAFIMPLFALTQIHTTAAVVAICTLIIQFICYIPTLRYYSLPVSWGLSLPVAGLLYLLMTWHSAIRYYFSSGASWKGRSYQ